MDATLVLFLFTFPCGFSEQSPWTCEHRVPIPKLSATRDSWKPCWSLWGPVTDLFLLFLHPSFVFFYLHPCWLLLTVTESWHSPAVKHADAFCSCLVFPFWQTVRWRKQLQLFFKCRSIPGRSPSWYMPPERNYIDNLWKRGAACKHCLYQKQTHASEIAMWYFKRVLKNSHLMSRISSYIGTGDGNFRLSSHILTFTTDVYLLFICHCSPIQSISEKSILYWSRVFYWDLVGFLHIFNWALPGYSLEVKKKKTITGVFCMVAPKNHIKLLGLFPLAWTGGEESLKFLQLNWKKRQRVKVVKHRSETPSSVLLTWS